MEEEKEMPEGLLICKNKKMENGSGEVKCVDINTFGRFLDSQTKMSKCRV